MPFADIRGHRHVLDLLRRGVARERVPQSLLFAGPDGVGKHAVAIALAQAVNCPVRRAAVKRGSSAGAAQIAATAAVPASVAASVPLDDACGTCGTCRRIALGHHSDVVVIDQGHEASIKIKVLRDRLLALVGYRPFEAERRVFIIDPADALGREGQDSLLKTLEEPPTATIIILVTAFPDALSATVQSRCRRVRFGPLSDADVYGVLTEARRVDAVTARLLASMSGGSVAAALAAQSSAVSDDRDAAIGLLMAGRQPSAAGRLQAAAALVQHKSKRRDREALDARLTVALALIRDMGARAAGAPDEATITDADVDEAMRSLSAVYGLERLSRAYGALRDAQTWLERNASPKLVADWVAMSL